MKEKEKFWMIVTVNGSICVDEDKEGCPILYNEQEVQKRAKALAIELGEEYIVCVMEYVFGERGKMITERLNPMRPLESKTQVDAK